MKFWLVRLVSILAAFAGCLALETWGKGSLSSYGYSLLVLSGIYVTLSVSLNLINGITGQFSIGHAAFYMVGAYVCAFFTKSYFATQGLNSTMWGTVMVVVAALGAGVAGLLVGLPSLRLRGDYLAIVTLGFGEIIRVLVQNIPALGGSYGMDVKVRPAMPAAFMVWMLAIVCIAVSRNLLRTVHGLPFLAVREDEVASSAMGVRVTNVKVVAFVVGSMFAGAAGALYAPFQGFMGPANFDMYQSFIVLTMVVLGGTGSITGAAIAGLGLFLVPEYLRLLKDPTTGREITVSGAQVLGAFLGIMLAVWALRRVQLTFHGSTAGRQTRNLVAVAVGAALAALVGLAGSAVPILTMRTYKMADLRMAIFSLVLIAIMLLRPQGLLADREFSWTGLGALFKRRAQGAGA